LGCEPIPQASLSHAKSGHCGGTCRHIFAENPSYASFLVSQELASKIQIAVLPVGTDNNVLSSLLQSSLIPAATTQASASGRKGR
jgi:hypothetical protein